jgi:hypothetical protein
MRRIALLILLLSAAVAVPGSARAATCAPPKYPGSGYFTSLRVSHVSCSTGRKFVVAYYKCRTKHGVKGRCTSRVSGYRCTEKRHSISTEIDARVSCKRGSRSIVHTYQQNT